MILVSLSIIFMRFKVLYQRLGVGEYFVTCSASKNHWPCNIRPVILITEVKVGMI